MSISSKFDWNNLNKDVKKRVMDAAAKGMAGVAEDMARIIEESVGEPRNRMAELFQKNSFVVEPAEYSGTRCEVGVSYGGDRTRYSLYRVGYPEAVDIVALFHNGMQTRQSYGNKRPHRVFGEWHGKKTYGVARIERSGFIKRAVGTFNNRYSVLGYTATCDGKFK